MSYLWQQHEYLCLSYQLYIDSVVAELFHCHLLHLAVPVSLVSWSHELISCCFLESISCTTPVLLPLNVSTKSSKSCIVVFRVWLPLSVYSKLYLPFHWLVVIVTVGKITDQDFPEFDFVQLRRTLHGDVW